MSNEVQVGGSRVSNINLTDIICEGPIYGLKNGLASFYLNDTSVLDANLTGLPQDSLQTSTAIASITFDNSSNLFTGTNVTNDILDVNMVIDANNKRRLNILDFLGTETSISLSANTSSNAAVEIWTVENAFDNFSTAWENLTYPVNTPAKGVLFKEGNYLEGDFTYETTKKLRFRTTFPSGIEEGGTSGYSARVRRDFALGEILSASTLRLRSSEAVGDGGVSQAEADDLNGTYKFTIGAAATGAGTADQLAPWGWSNLTKINQVSIDFRVGELAQNPTKEVGGVGGVVGVIGNTGLITNRELKQISATGGLPDGFVRYDTGGQRSPIVENDNPTEMSSAAFGLTSDQIAATDYVYFTFRYPSLQTLNIKGGGDEVANAFYLVQVAVEKDGSFGEWVNAYPSAPEGIVKHRANTNAPIEFARSINLNRYRPFDDFKVRIFRLTRSTGMPVRNDGTKQEVTDYDKWQLQAKCAISNLGAVIKDKFTYPYTALASISFDSTQYQRAPKRSYELRGLLVKVPSNYTPREYAEDGVASYDGFWDGSFKEGFYTDNPAWVFYDMVTNNRYGAGRWIKEADIDKYALYRIARYCDELVDDGNGNIVEPRFRANLFLTKATDVYKVLKDMATIFTGILYWQDQQITPVADTPADPVYNFSKGNVIGGEFAYESTGLRTRVNQVIVTYNEPTSNYEPVPIIVEDRESIVRTGRIISQPAVAFGATSEGQAIRYGRWKLWTAQNQTQIVNFKTGLAAHYIRPGDVISVQDAGRVGIQLSGRVKDSTNNTVSSVALDRDVNLNSTSKYELSILVNSPAAMLADSDPVTIEGVDTYNPGDVIPQAYVNGTLDDLDTKEKASNAFTAASGGDLIPTIFKPYTYVESKSVNNLTSTSSVLTTRTNFSVVPAAETIWALKEELTGAPVEGSAKLYRVLSIKEENINEFAISAVEFYNQKFQAVDKDYALGYLPDSILPEKEPDVIPPPRNLRIVANSDKTKPGEELKIEWDMPLSENEDGEFVLPSYITGYELAHTIPGIPSPIRVNDANYFMEKVPNGAFDFAVRCVTFRGNASSYAVLSGYKVFDIYAENVPRLQGGIPRGVVASVNGGLVRDDPADITTTKFVFADPDVVLASIANRDDITTVFESSQSLGNIPVSGDGSQTGSPELPFYVFADASQSSLRLMYYDTDHFEDAGGMPYWRDVGDGSEYSDRSAGWAALIGTVSVSANSLIVRGTGTSFSAELLQNDIINFSNGNSPTAATHFGKVTKVVSNSVLYIDRHFETAVSGNDIFTPTYRADPESDGAIARVVRKSASIELTKYITVDSSLSSQRFGIITVNPPFAQYSGSSAAIEQIGVPDVFNVTVAAVGFTKPEFRITTTSGIDYTPPLSYSAGNGVDIFTYTFSTSSGALAYDQNSIQTITASIRETANIALFERTATFEFPKIRDGVPGPEGAEGAAGSDARTVKLTSEKFAQRYDQDGDRLSGGTITITASSVGLSADVAAYYEFYINDVSVESASTRNTLTYTFPDKAASTPEIVEVALRDSENGVTLARDQITLYGLEPGLDAYTVILTNEAHAMPQQNTAGGGTIDYTDSGTDIIAYRGLTPLLATTDVPANNQFRITASSTNISIGNLQIVGDYRFRLADTSISAITAGTAKIEYTFSSGALDGEIIKTQTFSKSVEGEDGDLGENARAVSLSTTTLAFTYDQDGLNPSPTSVIVEANAIETLSDDVYYEWLVAGTVIKNDQSNTITYTPSASSDNMPQTIQVNVRETASSSATVYASDIITMFGVVPGSDAYTVVAPNLSHVLSASSNGVVESFVGSGTTIQVYKGAELLSFSSTAGIGTFSVTASSAHIGLGNLTGAGGNNTTATLQDHQSLSADRNVANVDFVVNAEGKVSYRLTQSVVKSRAGVQGATGEGGRTVSISASKIVFVYDAEGANPATTSQNFTAVPFNTTGTVFYEFFVDNVSQGSPNQSNEFTYSVPTDINTLPQSIKVEIRESESSNDVVATDSVNVIGIRPGAAGTDAYYVSFTNPAHSFTASSNGVVNAADLGGSGTDIQVYKGTQLLSFSSVAQAGTFALTKTDLGITSGAISGLNTTTATIADVVSFSADKTRAEVQYTISAENLVSFTLTQTYSKSRKGAPGPEGEAGRTVSISASNLALTFAADGSTPDRNSQIFEANAFNTSGTVFYDFLVDGSSVQNNQTNLYTLDTSSYTYDDLPKNIAVRIRESASTGNILAQDSLVFVGLRPGEDAYTLVFPNSSHTFTASKLGVVSDYANSGTTFQVYKGTQLLTFSNTEAAGSFAITKADTSISSGGLTGQGTTTATVGPHNDYTTNANTAKIVYTLSVDNAVVITAEQTFSLSKTGADGVGTQGDPGIRYAEGYIYYQSASTAAPGTSGLNFRYEWDTDSFSALGASTLVQSGWDRQPPNNVGQDGQFWVSRWSVLEEASEAGQGTITFDASRSSTNFTDVVVIGNLSDGTTTIAGDNILTGDITLGTGDALGSIKGGKTSYSDTTAGFFLGFEGSDTRFSIGDSNDSLAWTGSTLEITGNITASVLNVTDATVLGELQATSLAAGTVTAAALSQGVLNLIDGRIEAAINATSPGYYLVNNFDTQKITNANPTYSLGTAQASNGLTIDLAITAAHYWSGISYSNLTGNVKIQYRTTSPAGTWTDALSSNYTIAKTLIYSYAGSQIYTYSLFINNSGTVTLTDGTQYDWRVVCSGADTSSPLTIATTGPTPFEASVVEGSSGVTSTGGTTTSSNFSESARFARSAGQAATAVFSNSANYAQSAAFAATANVSNSAAEAGKWKASKTVTFAGGDVTGSFSIDGSVDVNNVNLTVSGGDVSTANFSKSANFSRSANYAQSAGFATTANFSRSANYAQSAGNAAQLGGIAAANYLRSDTDDSTTGSLTFANNKGVKFLSTTGSSDATSYLYRAGGNATRFQYFKNSFIFDAKENNAFEIRNSADVANFTLTPNTTLTSARMYFSGEVGIGNSNPDKPLVVQSASEPEIVITHNVNKGTPRLRFRNGSSGASSIALVEATSSSIYLENKAGDQLILNGAGRAQVFENGNDTFTLLDENAFGYVDAANVRAIETPFNQDSRLETHIVYSQSAGVVFHKNLSLSTDGVTALASPVQSPSNLINTESSIFTMVGNISHVDGHVNGVTLLKLDFGDSPFEVSGETEEVGSLNIRADSIVAEYIAASTITGTEISATTTIKAGVGSNIAALRGGGDSSDDTEVRIFAGVSGEETASGSARVAPFRVTQGGALTATNATITGNVTANSGTIGGFTITKSSFYSGTGVFNNSNTPVYLSKSAGAAKGYFSLGDKLTWDGTTLEVDGQIAANSITATEIRSNSISAEQLAANAITATEIQADAITAVAIAANSISASQLTISNDSEGSTGIFMSASAIEIYDDQATPVLRVKIGKLT